MEAAADVPQEPVALHEGDTLILCTDGLWGVVGDNDLAAAVQASSPAESCAAAVRMALQRGGPDNITLQILRVTSSD